MRTYSLLTAVLLCCTAHAQEPAKTIAPLLDDDTTAVIHMDVARLKLDDLLGHAEAIGLVEPKARQELHKKLAEVHDQFTRAGGRDLFFVAGLNDLAAVGKEAPLLVVPLAAGADAGKIAAIIKKINPDLASAQIEKNGQRFLVAGSKSQVEGAKKRLAKIRAESVSPELENKLRETLAEQAKQKELIRAFDAQLNQTRDENTRDRIKAQRTRAQGELIAAERSLQVIYRAKEKLVPKPRPEFAKAFAAAGPGVIQLVFVPTVELRRTVEELVPTLPKELGNGPSKVLTQGMRWLAVGFDSAKETGEMRIVLQAADAEAAQAVRQPATAAIDVGLRGVLMQIVREAAQADIPIDAKGMDKTLALLKVKVNGDQVALTVPLNAGVQEFAKIISTALRGRATRAVSMNNLKQIGLACHLTHDVYKRFPGNIVDKNGKALLSWRVLILPYIEQGPLYQQFHLDEPWDSEHNKKLIAKMPATYRRSSSRADAGKTTYLMPVGANTVLCPDAEGFVLQTGKLVSRDAKKPGVRFVDITDGTSNTILAVDAKDEKAVIWSKPEDWVPDAKDPRKGVVGATPGGFLTVFGDGSARLLQSTISIETLRAYLTRNGGEVVP